MPNCRAAAGRSSAGCKRRRTELAALEEIAPLDARRAAAEQEADAAARRAARREESLKTARRRWREALAGGRAARDDRPEAGSPSGAARRPDRRNAAAFVAAPRGTCPAAAELDSFAARIVQLAADAGVVRVRARSRTLRIGRNCRSSLPKRPPRQQTAVERREAIRRERRRLRAAKPSTRRRSAG